MARSKIDAALAVVPLFQGLSKRQLKRVANLGEVADFMAGAPVVKEGESGDSFYVVLAGQAKVIVKRRTLHRLMPGDHFGEISLLDGGVRTASVVTETPMTMLVITRKAFLKEAEQDPQFARALLESLARMVRRTDRSLAR